MIRKIFSSQLLSNFEIEVERRENARARGQIVHLFVMNVVLVCLGLTS